MIQRSSIQAIFSFELLQKVKQISLSVQPF